MAIAPQLHGASGGDSSGAGQLHSTRIWPHFTVPRVEGVTLWLQVYTQTNGPSLPPALSPDPATPSPAHRPQSHNHKVPLPSACRSTTSLRPCYSPSTVHTRVADEFTTELRAQTIITVNHLPSHNNLVRFQTASPCLKQKALQ